MVVYREPQNEVNDVIFQEMDPDSIRQALQGQENILDAEVAKVDRYFESLACPYCRGAVFPVAATPVVFEGFLPKFLAECSDCGCQFEPYTAIELRGPQRNPLEFEVKGG